MKKYYGFNGYLFAQPSEKFLKLEKILFEIQNYDIELKNIISDKLTEEAKNCWSRENRNRAKLSRLRLRS